MSSHVVSLSLTLGLALAVAQAPPAFETASIKSVRQSPGRSNLVAIDTDPGMVRYVNVTLKTLVALAYRLDERQVSGAP